MLSGKGKVCKLIGSESAAALAFTIDWEAKARAGIPPMKRIPPSSNVAIPSRRPILDIS